jgi:NAD(P)H-flavin reductase
MKGMENKPREYTGTIIKKSQLTKTVFHFVIQNENPATLAFQAGQYATFIIDEKTRRQYSFCSAPNATSFELLVDTSPMGTGSQYFLKLEKGERVEYLAPLGNFTLNDNPLKKVLVATGAGIAPFRSMLLNETEITNSNPPAGGQIPKRPASFPPSAIRHSPISLYWGLRYEADVYWDQEFRDIAGQYTGFQYYLCLSKPSDGWEVSGPPSLNLPPGKAGLRRVKGHVTEHVLNNEKNPQQCEFYLCGNRSMIEEMVVRLQDRNIEDERIKTDMYY